MRRVGEGATKKEAKRQAAGAVLEGISFPTEKKTDSECKGQNETKDFTIEITNNKEQR